MATGIHEKAFLQPGRSFPLSNPFASLSPCDLSLVVSPYHFPLSLDGVFPHEDPVFPRFLDAWGIIIFVVFPRSVVAKKR
jgi:hypothetical protein